MKCSECPARIVEEGNESDPTTYYYCFYGEEYEDTHCRDFVDGTCGCLKKRKTILRDLEEEEENRARAEGYYQEELEFETRMQEQLMQNYDFERGDVKY